MKNQNKGGGVIFAPRAVYGILPAILQQFGLPAAISQQFLAATEQPY